jgi:hypothetical protein
MKELEKITIASVSVDFGALLWDAWDVKPMAPEHSTIPAYVASTDAERQAALDRLSRHAFDLGLYDRSAMPAEASDEQTDNQSLD